MSATQINPDFPYYSYLVGGHGHCKILGWGQHGGAFTPKPPTPPAREEPPPSTLAPLRIDPIDLYHFNENLIEDCSITGWWAQLQFEDGHIAEQHQDMIEPLWARYPSSAFPEGSAI